jgi:osmotically inducible protein OsmC
MNETKEFDMKRKGSAKWQGGLKNGKGTVSSESGVLDQTNYSFHTRFEDAPGTNPEELIAAAHAGCFSMALSAELEKAGYEPESVETDAILDFVKKEEGFTVTRILLDTKAKVPGIKKHDFDQIAGNAKVGCPVSRLLKTDIVLNAELV